jgi:hypothetical protein
MKVLLEDWRDETSLKNPTMSSLLDGIPHHDKICPTQLLGVMIKHDTCNAAESVGKKLEEAIKSFASEKGIPRDQRSDSDLSRGLSQSYEKYLVGSH